MKPDLYLGDNPYYFKYSRVSYTCVKEAANLDNCWYVYSPREKDFELMKEGLLKIDRADYPIHNVNITTLYNILNSLRRKECLNPCSEFPCEEYCVHCKCLNCLVCDIKDYWEDKC